MKYYKLVILFLFSAFAKAQTTHPAVELIEDKQPKRWMLYAQNNTNEEQEAFLMVQGEGFRRSADRPVIKKVPPNSKVLMITLIPLKGINPTYETIFTFENQLQTIEQRKGANREEYVNIRALKADELTIFLEEDCEKCDYLIEYLNKNHIKYRRLDIKKNGKVFDFMWEHLDGKVPKSDVVQLPVIMENNKVYHNIVNMKRFIEVYKWTKN